MLTKMIGFFSASLTLSTALAAGNVTGMVCDTERNTKMVVSIDLDGADARVGFRGSRSLGESLVLYVSKEAVAPILENQLAKMHNKKVSDSQEGVELSFQKDGADFSGQIRLSIKIRSKSGDERLENCNLTFESKMNPY